MWRWGVSGCALAAALVASGAALGQTGNTAPPAAPPVAAEVDPQGVDVITGQFNYGYASLTVG